MEYKINKTPLMTTNNFGINDIKLDLNIPRDLKNFNYKVNNYDKSKINISLNLGKELESRIGLNIDVYYDLNIKVADNYRTNMPLIIEYNLDSDLISRININIGSNSNINIIIKLLNNNYTFNYLKQVTNLGENSKANISLINLFDNRVTNLVAIESNLKENSILDYNYIDLGSNIKVSNYYAKLDGNNCVNNLNNIYFGNDSNILDMNYYIGCSGLNTKANIESEGVLKDNAKKNYKGTIDFISGCKGSSGDELENCILLSDTAKSKSLPMLLCGEEDVSGSHGVSTGKISKEKLFYIESKGLSEIEATKLIINGNFNKILKNIKNDDIINEINRFIEKRI